MIERDVVGPLIRVFKLHSWQFQLRWDNQSHVCLEPQNLTSRCAIIQEDQNLVVRRRIPAKQSLRAFFDDRDV